MPVERELPAKIGRCYEKPFGHNFQISALTLNQRYFIYIKIPLIQWLGSILKIVAERFCETPQKVIFFSRNKGQLRAAVSQPCRLSTPFCHTYSEPSGHEDSPGGTQNIPYLFKNLNKSRLSDPFLGFFLVISEVGSQIYIANLAIFKI